MPHIFWFSRRFVALSLVFWLAAVAHGQPKAPPSNPSPAERPELALQLGHSQTINKLTYSPDGKLLVSGSADNTLKIWDAQSRELIRTLEGHSAPIHGVAFSPDGKTLATGDTDGVLKFWNPQTGVLVRQWSRLLFGIHSLAYSPDGRYFTAACGSRGDGLNRDDRGQWVLWDTRTWEVLQRPVLSNRLDSMAFSPDSKYVAVGSNGGIRSVSIRDVPTGTARRLVQSPSLQVRSIAYSPDGKTLAVVNKDEENWKVQLWNVGNGKLQREMRIPNVWIIKTLAFSPDGINIGVATQNPEGSLSGGGSLWLWNTRTGILRSMLPTKGNIHSLAFSPDGSALASAESNEIHLRNVEPEVKEASMTFAESRRAVQSIAYSHDTKTVTSVSGLTGEILLWDTHTGTLQKTLFTPRTPQGKQRSAHLASFSPNGKILATVIRASNNATDGSEVFLWNVANRAILRTFATNSDILSLAWTPDGKSLAAGGRNWKQAKPGQQINLWDVRTGILSHTWQGASGAASGLAFSLDGKILASSQTGSENKIPLRKGDLGLPLLGRRGINVITLRDTHSGEVLATLSGHTDNIFAVAFSPDGKLLASAGMDKTIRVWEIRTRKPLRILQGHTDWVHSIAFSPNGKTLVSGSHDNSLRIWDVATGKQLRVLQGHEGNVTSVAFSPDGKRIVSGSRDTTVRLWNAADGRELVSLLTAPEEDTARSTPDLQTEPLWLATTPQGYYNCAEGADYLIKWRFGGKLMPFYHFEETYRRPDLLQRALRGEPIAARPLLITRVPPAIRLIALANAPNKPGKIRVLMQAADDSELLNSNFQFYVNGVLIPDQVAKPIVVDGKPIVVDGKPIVVDGKPIIVDGKPIVVDGKPIVVDGKPIVVDGKPMTADGRNIPGLQKIRASDGAAVGVNPSRSDLIEKYNFHRLYVMDVALPAEEKIVLRAVVTDNEGNKSDDGLTMERPQIEPRKGNLYVLAIGVSSYRNPLYNISYAAADARSIAATLDAQQGRQYARVQTTILNDAKANVRNIRAALRVLKAARPDDTVMVFLSGHGIAAGGKTYFAPWGVFVRDLPGTCIEWNEIVGNLSGLYAKKLLFTDACHSGAKLGNWQATSSQLAEAVRRESGIVMFASSQANEFSFEDKEVKQGTFSRALADGFSGHADIDDDGNITLPELAMYVPKRVSESTNGLQNPQLVLVQDFNPQTVLAKVGATFKKQNVVSNGTS